MDQAAYIYDELGRLQRASFQDISIAYNYDDMGNRTSVVAANIPTGVQVIIADTTLTAGSPPITIAKLVRSSDLTVTLPDASTVLGQNFTLKRDSTGGRSWKWTNTGIISIPAINPVTPGVQINGAVSMLGGSYFTLNRAFGGSTLYKLNAYTWLQEASVSTISQNFHDMIVSQDGTKLFLSGVYNDVSQILVYSTTDLSLLQTIILTGNYNSHHQQLALSIDGTKLYTNTNQGVVTVNTDSYGFALLVNAPGHNSAVCVSPDYIFVSHIGSGNVSIGVYDITSGAFVTSITMGSASSSYLAYDPNEQRVWSINGPRLVIIDAVALSVLFNNQYHELLGSRVMIDTANGLAYVGQSECIQVFDLSISSGDPNLITSLKSPLATVGNTQVVPMAILPNNHLLVQEWFSGAGSAVGSNYYDVDPSNTIGDNVAFVSGQSGQLINGNSIVKLANPVDSIDVVAYQDPVTSAYGWAIQSEIASLKQDHNVVQLPKFQQQDFANELMIVKLSDGSLIGWGDNTGGALCNAQTAGVSPPTPVQYDSWLPPDPHSTIIDWALTSTNLFVVFSDGSAYAGGQNAAGQLGDTTTAAKIYLKRVAGLPNTVNRVWASSGAAGNSGMVFYGTSDHKLYACGLNNNGQLGIGSTTNANIPALSWNTGAFSDVVIAQSNANYWTFLITDAGTVKCTGANAQGQLGLGNTTQQTSWMSPTISGAGNIIKVRTIGGGVTRYSNTMVLDSNGVVYTTGSNLHGQLSTGNTTARTSFAPIILNYNYVLDPKFLDCGYGNGQFPTCWALTDVGSLWTWGYGAAAALFTESTADQLIAAQQGQPNLPCIPQVLRVLSPVMNTAVNSPQTLVLCSDGALKFAGNANGLYGSVDQNLSVGVKDIPAFAQLPFAQNEISDMFMHGVGTTQRLFVLTKKGKLFALGNNTNAIATGGLAYSTTNTTGMWYQIEFGRYQR